MTGRATATAAIVAGFVIGLLLVVALANHAKATQPALTVTPLAVGRDDSNEPPRSSVVSMPAIPRGEIAEATWGIRGRATWYCGNGSPCTQGYGPGLYAAAGSELRHAIGKGWRYSVVKVCSAGGCVQVQLVDTCACGGRRVIDLYRYAFTRIASPSAGVVGVTITPFLVPAPPPTDTVR